MPLASETARALARCVEEVCRHYLSNGRRSGSYWIVGDVYNTPGRSLFVRLRGPDCGPGARGKWMDAATGEHGDLLDLIRLTHGFKNLRETIEEARRFLQVPPPLIPFAPTIARHSSASTAEAARRLYARTQPMKGTDGEAYLKTRGIDLDLGPHPLRFHPRLIYRDGDDVRSFPGLVAAVTNNAGYITGVHRLFLDPHTPQKADVNDPRRALGHLLGHGVRFGKATTVLAAGEGIETMLSLKMVLPALPLVATGSAAHLAAFDPPAHLTHLYIARDDDAAGIWAATRLEARAIEKGVASIRHLIPALKDFNDDLRKLGPRAFAERLAPQLAADELAHLIAFA